MSPEATGWNGARTADHPEIVFLPYICYSGVLPEGLGHECASFDETPLADRLAATWE